MAHNKLTSVDLAAAFLYERGAFNDMQVLTNRVRISRHARTWGTHVTDEEYTQEVVQKHCYGTI